MTAYRMTVWSDDGCTCRHVRTSPASTDEDAAVLLRRAVEQWAETHKHGGPVGRKVSGLVYALQPDEMGWRIVARVDKEKGTAAI